MSIIRDAEVSLATIISESNVIVSVKCIETFEEEVPVLSEDGTESVKPFIKKGFVFEVKHVFKNTSNHAVHTFIRVPHENWKRFLSQYKEHYANGPSKSFTVKNYVTEVPSMQEADVLFLHSFQDSYQLVAKNAFEKRAKKDEIERLLKISY